jgi:hypothetical protein
LGREEEVEAVGLEEDLDVVGALGHLQQRRTGLRGGGGHEEGEEGAGLYEEGVGVMGLLQDLHPHTDLGVATSFALL